MSDALVQVDAAVNHLYVVITYVPRRTEVTVGARGCQTFERGWFAYVGSALVARDARVARHLRANKRLRWHADYLLAIYPGRRAWLLDTSLSECALVDVLAGQTGAQRAVAGFGAGDCHCAGHLLRLPHGTALDGALRAGGGRLYKHAPPAARPPAARPPAARPPVKKSRSPESHSPEGGRPLRSAGDS
jgi:Uri superfamily endonuclease